MPFLDDSLLDSIMSRSRGGHGIMKASTALVRKAADALEVGGSALAFGYIGARYGVSGEYDVGGLPVDLWGAIAGLGLAWSGFADGYERDVEMLGAGALASYLARQGASWGASAQQAATTQTSGRQELVGGRSPLAFGAAQQAAVQAGQQFAIRAL
jgi:hypothetical protein